jgi:hypothetical protein
MKTSERKFVWGRLVSHISEKKKRVSRANQARGKIRRFYKSHFAKEEVKVTISMREGECGQCGQCCKILFRCPFLGEKEGKACCNIYEWRFEQCKLYPIEPKDFEEIPEQCCFHFELRSREKPAKDENA